MGLLSITIFNEQKKEIQLSADNGNQILKPKYQVDTSFYLDKFQKAADKLDKRFLTKKQVESAVAMYGKDCVVLKLYKR